MPVRSSTRRSTSTPRRALVPGQKENDVQAVASHASSTVSGCQWVRNVQVTSGPPTFPHPHRQLGPAHSTR